LPKIAEYLQSDISPVFEVADILWVRMDTAGFRAEKKATLIAEI
jgi:hypothetical protein